MLVRHWVLRPMVTMVSSTRVVALGGVGNGHEGGPLEGRAADQEAVNVLFGSQLVGVFVVDAAAINDSELVGDSTGHLHGRKGLIQVHSNLSEGRLPISLYLHIMDWVWKPMMMSSHAELRPPI